MASIAISRALDDDPDYSAAHLLDVALTRAIDPLRMLQLGLPS